MTDVVNEQLGHYADEPYETHIIHIDPRELVLLEVNARYMRHETFHTLVENIRRDGQITQYPFASMIYEPDAPDGTPTGKYEVLSGNHRVKGSIEAELDIIPCIVTDDWLPRQRKIAIQLSHNAISGEDDPVILKQLYDELEDVDWREYSGLDDRTLQMLEDVDLQGLSEANLEFTTVTLTFLPNEVDEAKAVFEEAGALIASDEAWIARMAEYDRFIEILQMAQSSFKVGNTATALMIVLEIVGRHLQDFQAGWLDASGENKHDGLVNIATILGDVYLPASSAAVLKQAVDKMEKAGEVDPNARVRALEFLAADFLGGPDL